MLQRSLPSLLASSIRKIVPLFFLLQVHIENDKHLGSKPQPPPPATPDRQTKSRSSWKTVPWANLPVCSPAPARRAACLKAADGCWQCYVSWLPPQVLRPKRRIPFKTSLCLCQLLPPHTQPFNTRSHQGEGGMRGQPSRAWTVHAREIRFRHSHLE